MPGIYGIYTPALFPFRGDLRYFTSAGEAQATPTGSAFPRQIEIFSEIRNLT
jgi:hypothetical protein